MSFIRQARVELVCLLIGTIMILYCNTSRTACYASQELARFLNVNSFRIDMKVDALEKAENLLMLFIPVFGEEELNDQWLYFLESAKVFFNKKNLMVFFFGVYDDYVSFDSTLVKQIQHILYLECNDINFYPKKISKYNLDLGLMKRYIAEYRVLDQPRIDCKKKVMQLERRAKCLVAINDDDCLDLTSSYDGFTNILETLELNETILTLKSLLMLSYHGDFICNRIDLADFDFNGIFSKYIRKIYFKSCKINHTPFLNDFKNLELINFSANYVSVLDFFNFPNGLKRINFSKNRIDLVIVNNDSTYEKIESLSLFNNKISEFSWLSSMKNIRYLNLGMNPVKDFPLEILGLEKIEHINLALTEIKCIPNEIIYMESLRVLDVKNCPNMNLSDSIFEKLKTKGVQLIC